MSDYSLIKSEIEDAMAEVLDVADLEEEDILVIGCSTSEVVGERIGQGSNIEVAETIMSALLPRAEEDKIFLAIQCCEHINRALVVEEECAKKYDLEIVSVLPHARAGGSLGQVSMERFEKPVVVESIKSRAKAGMDIGDTLIGMHLKRVAVPLRLSVKKIGEAHLTSAYTRPPLIGGQRAIYDEKIKSKNKKFLKR